MSVLSGDPVKTAEGYKTLETDVQFFKAQILALQDIFNIVSKREISVADAQRMIEAINQLGLFYVKLAQTASNLSFVLPERVTAPLKVYQDSIEPIVPEIVNRIIIADFGQHPNDLFTDFDPGKPIAAGSIGNTYLVTTKREGLKIIFKVQRPDLDRELNWNRKLNHLALKTAGVLIPYTFAPIFDFIVANVIGLENGFEDETDFRKEARNLMRFRALFRFQSGVRIPKPHLRYTSKNCIGMEPLSGYNIDKSVSLAKPDVGFRERAGIESYLPYQIWALRNLTQAQLLEMYNGSNPKAGMIEKMRAHTLRTHFNSQDFAYLVALPAEQYQSQLAAAIDHITEYENLFRNILKSFLYRDWRVTFDNLA